MKLELVTIDRSKDPGFRQSAGSFSPTCRTVVGKSLAVCLLVLTLVMPQAVNAKELRLAHFMSPQHVMHTQLMAPWAEQIKHDTNGELVIHIFPARQLGGSPPGQYNMAVGGIADITFGLQGYTASRFPLSTVSELPGFADDAEEATGKLWSLWDEYIHQEYHDTHPLAIWTADINIIVTRDKPVRSLEDIEGMRIRTPSRFSGEVLKALGASPVSMPVTEMYTSLERGIVDGVMIPASAVKSFDLVEVANYFTLGAPLGFSPYFLTMNKRAYQGLSNDVRKTLNESIGEALSNKGAAAYQEEGDTVLESVKSGSAAEVVQLEAGERDRWLKAVAPAVREWLQLIDEAGARSQGEEMVQKLGLGSE